MTDRALDGLRVLDVTGAVGSYCGKLFADLGADVILVEPPGGASTRTAPPFLADPADDSLLFRYFNGGKRGVCLDLDTTQGQQDFRALADTADLVVEDARPGLMAQRGLDGASLRATNPRLVVTSISPFGQIGPYAQYEHSDLVCLALGGLLWLVGYRDAPPIQVAGEQAYMGANVYAAVASLIALTAAELRGTGQDVDVSVQACVTTALENSVQFVDLEGIVRSRYAGEQKQAGFGIFPCADGHVFLIAGGIGGNRFGPNLVDWVSAADPQGGALIAGDRWGERSWIETDEAKELFASVFTAFAQTHTKAQLYRESQQWRVPLCPVQGPDDVVRSEQLAHRGFFTSTVLGEREVQFPGAPYRLSATPWAGTLDAPGLGEHNSQLLVTLGDVDVRAATGADAGDGAHQ